MKKIMNWVMAATLVCGASVFTACSDGNEDNPNKEQGKKNRTEFIQHTRQNLKYLASNMNFASWNAANSLNYNFNKYVLNNPEFEEAVLITFLKEAAKTIKPVEEGSELAEMGYTSYGTADLTDFNYRFVMNDANTGFDVEESDEFEVLINAWHPETQQVEKGLYKLTLKAGGDKKYKFVIAPKQMDGIAFVFNVPSEFQYIISDKISGTWNVGFKGTFQNHIATAEGHEFVEWSNIKSWGVSGVLDSTIPAVAGQKADKTTLSFSLMSDRVNHKGNSALSWEQNGKKMFDLSIKDSGEVVGGISNLGLSEMGSNFTLFDLVVAILSGRSVDEAKLTLLDDLTTTLKISDCAKALVLQREMTHARRNSADMKTIEQYTQQLNQLISGSMTCKGLNNMQIPMKLQTIKFGVDYCAMPALNFADENGYVPLTDMLDKESIEYMFNIVDHSVEPMKESFIVVGQLAAFAIKLASAFQTDDEEEYEE